MLPVKLLRIPLPSTRNPLVTDARSALVSLVAWLASSMPKEFDAVRGRSATTPAALLVRLFALSVIGPLAVVILPSTVSAPFAVKSYVPPAPAVLLAVFAVLNLIIAGQPWGIVYGLGLWGAKIATWFGADLAANAYWGNDAHQVRLESSLLTDVTSVTNLGLLIGALIAANFRGRARPATSASGKQWLVALVTGLVLGYSARLAFGCNVGAYFSGISTGSLHGWVWFVAAFAGSFVGIPLRERLGLKA